MIANDFGLVAQRVFGLALGYEDLNDHDELRSDPVLGALLGKLDGAGGVDGQPRRLPSSPARLTPPVAKRLGVFARFPGPSRGNQNALRDGPRSAEALGLMHTARVRVAIDPTLAAILPLAA
jgi:hypothetical protein